MKTDILTIGTEYLTGMIQETDSFYMAGRLAELDAELAQRTIVGDNPDDVRNFLQTAFDRVDMILVTGAVKYGKHPAYHSIFADCFDDRLSFRKAVYEHMQEMAKKMHLHISDKEIKGLAEIPEQARILFNHEGLICGYILTDGRRHLVVLPGDSGEIRSVFEDDVVGYVYGITSLGKSELVIELKEPSTEKAHCCTEAMIRDKLGGLLAGDNPKLTLIREEGRHWIRVHAVGPTRGDAAIMAWIAASDCCNRLGEEVAGAIKYTN